MPFDTNIASKSSGLYTNLLFRILSFTMSFIIVNCDISLIVTFFHSQFIEQGLNVIHNSKSWPFCSS